MNISKSKPRFIASTLSLAILSALYPAAYALEGKVVLDGNVVVTDDSGKVTGQRMTLLQGQRRVIVEGDRATGKRATMTLPEIKPRAE